MTADTEGAGTDPSGSPVTVGPAGGDPVTVGPAGGDPAPVTLGIDVGGTALKMGVLDATGRPVAELVSAATPYPLAPGDLVGAIVDLSRPLPPFDRVSIGFPGAVRDGVVLSAPHFVRPAGPSSDVDPALSASWVGCDLARAVSEAIRRPTRMLNDADVHGLAVVNGAGLELVVTLGAGVGTSVFFEGRLAPHLELATHAFKGGHTYNDWLGDRARRRIGVTRWNQRLRTALQALYDLLHYDRVYLGGGNERHIRGELDANVTRVPNRAGVEGAIGVWRQPPPWGTR